MTHPLPVTPAGMPIELFQMTGIHGAVWTYEYYTPDPYPGGDDPILCWSSPGRNDTYATVDTLNVAHGPLRWNHAPYPPEDRTKPAYGGDGQEWIYNSARGGWVKNPCPSEESDDCLSWNFLVYAHDAGNPNN